VNKDVHNRKTSAYWYAVGWHDSMADAGVEVEDHSHEFAVFAATEAEHYYVGHVFMLQSVSDQWKRYLTGEPAITSTVAS